MNRQILLLPALLCISGCSILNMFKGPDDYDRHYMAEDFKRSIDSSVRYEAAKGATPGFIDRTYSEENWNTYWDSRIYYLFSGVFSEAYVGPTEMEFYEYIILERRRAELPELELTERTTSIISSYGRDDTRSAHDRP